LTELREEPPEAGLFSSPVAAERHEHQRDVAPVHIVESLVLRTVNG